MYQNFNILSERTKEYRRFNASGKQITVRHNPPSDFETNPVGHFLTGVNELFEYALQNVGDGDMVGLTTRNEIKQDKPFDQISSEVI
jgi:hypothetical protein